MRTGRQSATVLIATAKTKPLQASGALTNLTITEGGEAGRG
jgi:hypothetical protein